MGITVDDQVVRQVTQTTLLKQPDETVLDNAPTNEPEFTLTTHAARGSDEVVKTDQTEPSNARTSINSHQTPPILSVSNKSYGHK